MLGMKRVLLLGLGVVAIGCDADAPPPAAQWSASEPQAAAATPASPAPDSALPDFAEQDVDESLRDPFQPPTDAAPPPPPERSDVSFHDQPARSLRVVGTVLGSGPPSAILGDGSGATEVLTVGDRLGALEKGADGAMLEWSVDRIREGRVFLRRDAGGVVQTAVLGEPTNVSQRNRSASRSTPSGRR